MTIILDILKVEDYTKNHKPTHKVFCLKGKSVLDKSNNGQGKQYSTICIKNFYNSRKRKNLATISKKINGLKKRDIKKIRTYRKKLSERY